MTKIRKYIEEYEFVTKPKIEKFIGEHLYISVLIFQVLILLYCYAKYHTDPYTVAKAYLIALKESIYGQITVLGVS